MTGLRNRPICHEVQQQVAFVCVTGTGSPGHSSGCAQSAMVGSGSIHLPTISHIGQSADVAGLPMQENHSDCSGVAHHVLVLGSSGHVQPNPTEPAQFAQPVDTTIQSDPSQKSASAFEELAFTEAVAAKIEAPQRGSTSSFYEAKWTIVTSGASLIMWTSGYPCKVSC